VHTGAVACGGVGDIFRDTDPSALALPALGSENSISRIVSPIPVSYGSGVLSVIRGSRRGARRAVIGAILAACCLAFPAGAGAATKSASDIAPIVGTWKDGGAVINVTGGGGSFQGTVVSGSWGACNKGGPGVVVWKGLSGSGFSYSGQFPFVHSDDCSSAGDGIA